MKGSVAQDIPVQASGRPLALELRAKLKVSYALRRVPEACLASLLPPPDSPEPGDAAVARVEIVGKNTTLELATGRRSALHLGDAVAVVFGNRYATRQFEAYAKANGDGCDLISLGGLCGLVESRHANVAEPTKLRLLGRLGDGAGHPLKLRDFALPRVPLLHRPSVLAVCGSSMDAGKTHTAMSLIRGLAGAGVPVAGVKLTGTATGLDTWSLLDGGAFMALDFVDGGFPSTYLSSLNELLGLYEILVSHAGARGARWVVMEIADGLLQRETSMLLQCPEFRSTVSAWAFATGDPLGAAGGVSLLRTWGIEPLAISGIVSMSPLGAREAERATGLPCLGAAELQAGKLNGLLLKEDRA